MRLNAGRQDCNTTHLDDGLNSMGCDEGAVHPLFDGTAHAQRPKMVEIEVTHESAGPRVIWSGNLGFSSGSKKCDSEGKKRTVHADVLVEESLHGVTNGAHDLPARWGLAFWAQATGAGLARRDRGKQFQGN